MNLEKSQMPSSKIAHVTKIGKDENLLIWVMYRITYPLAKLLVYCRVSPNTITFLSLIFVSIANLAIINELKIDYFLYPWFFAVFLDLADGQVARMSNKIRRHSFSFDHISDLIKISGTLICLGFMYTSNLTWLLTSICICSILVTDQLNAELFRARTFEISDEGADHVGERSPVVTNIYTVFFTFNTHTLMVFPLLMVNRPLFIVFTSYFIFVANLSGFRFIYLLTKISRR